MKWASRFLIIFIFVFALLTGIYYARTGTLPWFQEPPPAVVEAPPEPTISGIPGVAAGGSVLEALNNETVALARKVLPSVVSITTTKVIQEVRMTPLDVLSTYFGFRRAGQVKNRLVLGGFGSGVIVSADGIVVTNHHVIEDMQDILLLLNDGRQLKAKVLAYNPNDDVAVLKVDAEGLQPLPMGNSDTVNVGEYVMAVGNPYGLHETVSIGNISAKARGAAPAAGGHTEGGADNQAFLQTDAMINRGHSGGPLVNIKGELIGLNRAIFTDRPNEGWQGIAFAIPANTVKQTLDRFLQLGRINGELGLSFREVTPNMRSALRLGDREGLLLGKVEETSLAGVNGLKNNDFIVSADGVATSKPEDLYAAVGKATTGRLELQLVRGGIPLSLPLILQDEQPGQPAEPATDTANQM